MEGQGGRRSLLASGLLVTVGSVLPSVSGGLLWIVASRILGGEGVGLASSIVSAGFMAAYLASLGLDMAIVRNLARLGASVLTTSIAVAVPLALLVSAGVAGLLSAKIPSQYMVLVYAFSASFVLSFLLLWGVVGARRSVEYAKITLASSIVKVIAGLGLAVAYGPAGIVAGFIAGSIVSAVLAVPVLSGSLKAGHRLFEPEVIVDGLSNYPNVLAGSLAANIGTVLAVLASDTLGDVGVFYLSLTISLLAGSFAYSLAYVAVSYRALDAYRDITRYAIFAGAVVAPALAAEPGLAYKVLGVDGDPRVMMLLAASIVGYSSLYMAISMLNASGDRVRLVAVGLSRLALLTFLSIALSGYGVIGVAAAYTLSIYISLLASGMPWLAWRTLQALAGFLVGALLGLLADWAPLVSALVASLSSLVFMVGVGLVGVDEIRRIVGTLAGRLAG
ncbi:MAG: hypothetical protein GSR84_03980 [Desulfurococcales archaeon]|nr:hypothetical protein [Desulfurococcales archaeon]